MAIVFQRPGKGPVFCGATARVEVAVEEIEEELGGAMDGGRDAADAVEGGFCGAATVTKPVPEAIVPIGAVRGKTSLCVARNSISLVPRAAAKTRRWSIPNVKPVRCSMT